MTNILLRFLPLAVVIILMIVWYIRSKKDSNVKLMTVKTWVITLTILIIAVVISIAVNFSMTDAPNEPYTQNKDAGSHKGKNVFDPSNMPVDIP